MYLRSIRNRFVLQLWTIYIRCGVASSKALEILNRYDHVEAKLEYFSPYFCRAVCTVFSTWLSEYPEDFKSLGEPSRLLRLAPLLPQGSSSAADLRARLLRIAEELSEKALLPDPHRGLPFKLDHNDTVKASLRRFFYGDTSSCKSKPACKRQENASQPNCFRSVFFQLSSVLLNTGEVFWAVQLRWRLNLLIYG